MKRDIEARIRQRAGTEGAPASPQAIAGVALVTTLLVTREGLEAVFYLGVQALALHAAQEVHGWCSPEAIHQVAAVMQVTPAYLSSVATFYDMLETEPSPRHDVYVCTNISCSLLGADELYAAIRAAADRDDDVHVREFECLGACDIAPMASVDGTYVGPLEPADAERILEDLRGGGPVLPDKQILRRPVADPEANSREYPRPEPRPQPSEFARSAGPEIPGDAAGPPAPLHDERHPPEPGKRQGTTP